MPKFIQIAACIAGLAVPTVAGAAGNNWMSGIAGTTRLSQLSIPGSHDSGARKEYWPGTSKCQDASLAEQLNLGLRFLDMRCRHINDVFAIHHGSVFQDMYFGEALNQVIDFLNANPGECVMMSVKEEYSSETITRSFEATFDSYVANNPGKWALATSIPTLESVRGKIVLVRRFGSVVAKGIDATNWPDNTAFNVNNLHVQDAYQVGDTGAKWNAVTSAIDAAAADTNAEVLHLNFTSGYTSNLLGIPSITNVSNYINSRVYDTFAAALRGHYGCVLMDFADSGRSTAIYNTNFITPGPLADGVYRLLAKHSGKAADVSGGSIADGALLHQWTWYGGNNQRWRLTNLGGGNYSIAALHSGKFMTVEGASTQNGGSVLQNPYLGTPNQIWRLIDNGDGSCRVANRNSGLVLDVNNGDTTDGAKMQQWSWGGGNNQRWTIEPANVAPAFTADPISASGLKDAPFSGALSASDADAGDTQLSYAKVAGPAWLQVASNGTLSGTPATANLGANGFVVRVTDAGGLSDEATLNITVAATPTWVNPAGGSWAAAANWISGRIGSGNGITADFSSLDLTSDATVTLDGARTLGKLVCGDTTPSHGWILNAGTSGSLVLYATSGVPAVVVNNQTVTLNLPLTGTQSWVKSGGGALILGGTSANTHSGNSIVDNGAVYLNKTAGAALPGPVRMGNGNTNQPNLRMQQNNQFGAATVMTFLNTSGNWARFDLAATSQSLAGLNAGTATTQAGAVIQNIGLDNLGTGTGLLTLNGTGTYLYNGQLRDQDNGGSTRQLALVKNGSGTQTFAGNQILFTGNTTINTGTLVFASSNVGRGTVTINNGGILQLTASNAIDSLAAITINAGGTLTAAQAAHNINSVLTINGGTLAATVPGLEAYGNFVLRNDLTTGGTTRSTIAADVRIGDEADRTCRVAATGDAAGIDLDFTGRLSHVHGINWGYLTKAGNGTLRLSNPANNIGRITINAGKVIFKDSMAGMSNGGLINNAAAVADIGPGITAAFGQAHRGSGTFTKLGAGTLVLSGTNTCTGATTVSQGTLELASPLAAATTTIAAAGTLAGTGTIAGAVSLSGALAPGGGGSGGLTINGALTLAPGAAIVWQVADWTGAAGTGYAKLAVAALNITASAASPVTLRISEQTLTHFTETGNTFTLIQVAGAITGFDPANFALNISGFSSGRGTWAILRTGNNLVLVYTRFNTQPRLTTNPLTILAAPGQAVTGAIAAVDPDLGEALVFTKVSGAAWLNVAADGTLTGTPGLANGGLNIFLVQVTDSGGLSAQATLNLSVTLTPTQAWQFEYFGENAGNPGVAGDAADPDGDGMLNLLEYSLGTHPRAATASSISHEVMTVGGSRHLRMIIPKNSAATDLIYNVQATSDLSQSNTWSGAGLVIETNTSSQLIVRDTVDGPRRFMRLQVSRRL
jgi:1-phosphatidylinositol phosphodiesterase